MIIFTQNGPLRSLRPASTGKGPWDVIIALLPPMDVAKH